MNNQNRFTRARNAVQNAATKVGTALTLGMVTVGSAMAQATGYDETGVIAKITENGGKAVLVVGAFIVAAWGIKSMGLLKRG